MKLKLTREDKEMMELVMFTVEVFMVIGLGVLAIAMLSS